MTGLFDGVAGLLNDTFGAPVTWLAEGFDPVTVHSRFRHARVEVPGSDGHPVLAMRPVWRVPADAALPRPPRRGDRIQPGDGATYLITAVQASGSPAADRFLACSLELLP